MSLDYGEETREDKALNLHGQAPEVAKVGRRAERRSGHRREDPVAHPRRDRRPIARDVLGGDLFTEEVEGEFILLFAHAVTRSHRPVVEARFVSGGQGPGVTTCMSSSSAA